MLDKEVIAMKKVNSIFIIVIMLLSMSFTAFAGDVPEGLLSNDDAQVFFGEVLDYNDNTVTVCPRVKIKGDVLTGTKQHYDKPYPVGNFNVKAGNVYLFTYFDENNETNIFEVTSYDTATLKIKNTDFDIWKRFESYLNDGEYEKAEQERIDKINATFTEEGDEISLTALLGVEKSKCDKVKIRLNGTREYFEIDKEKFYEVADNIYLTDIKNVLAQASSGSFDIVAYKGDKTYTVYMWDKCLVGGERTAMYSAPTGDYTIKASDYKELVSLFPEEAKAKLPPLNSPSANLLYWVFNNPTEAKVVATLIVVLLVGGIGFLFGYKIRKTKARR